jgi:hypothetical protein
MYGFAMRLDARWHGFPSLGQVHGHAGSGWDLDFARIATVRVFIEKMRKAALGYLFESGEDSNEAEAVGFVLRWSRQLPNADVLVRGGYFVGGGRQYLLLYVRTGGGMYDSILEMTAL